MWICDSHTYNKEPLNSSMVMSTIHWISVITRGHKAPPPSERPFVSTFNLITPNMFMLPIQYLKMCESFGQVSVGELFVIVINSVVAFYSCIFYLNYGTKCVFFVFFSSYFLM